MVMQKKEFDGLGCEPAAEANSLVKAWRRRRVRETMGKNIKLVYWVASKLHWRNTHNINVWDFAHEVALNALRYGHRFDPKRGSFSTWLEWRGRAAKKELVRFHTTQGRSACEEITMGDLIGECCSPCFDTHQWVDNQHNRITVRKVMALMSKKDRYVLNQISKGNSMEKIAKELCVSGSAVQQRMERIRKRVACSGIEWR